MFPELFSLTPSCGKSAEATVSRLENKPDIGELYGMGVFFVEEFIHSHAEEPECIIPDCDDSNFNAYGNQQGTLFNSYYDEYCYMPLFILEGISGKMILPLLRSGRRNKSASIFGILRRLTTLMRRHRKKTRFIVRGDAHFCSGEFMNRATEKDYVDFVFGMVKNAVPDRQVEQWKQKAESSFTENREEVRMFRTFSYRAGSWKYPQKVVARIEVNSCGTNVRHIVTGINHTSSRFLYESLYCGRGTMELYIREMKNYLSSDRCSCSRFSASRFRLFLHAAAYVLLHGLKEPRFTMSVFLPCNRKYYREPFMSEA